jgi:hypothetical protein
VTGYEKRINDLILLRNVGPSSGFFQQYFNGAALRNRGIEISAAATPIQSADATWIARVLFARNVSEITRLPVPAFETGGFGTSLGAFRIEEGESATQIVGRRNLGIRNAANTGDSIIVTQLGDAAPDFQMAFSSELNWRNWRLAGLVDWKEGGDVINLTEFLYDAAGNSPDYEAAGAQRQTRWAAGHTSEYVQDASYVKVREISLSYEVPQALANRAFGRQARYVRLELSGRNLFTSTDYRGLDPEVSNFGNQAIARNIDVAPYPPSRSFFFTIDVGF